jgi:hypothetical protein
MTDPNDGCSRNEHGAPWNEDDDGNCKCSHCRKRNRDRARDEVAEDRLVYAAYGEALEEPIALFRNRLAADIRQTERILEHTKGAVKMVMEEMGVKG